MRPPSHVGRYGATHGHRTLPCHPDTPRYFYRVPFLPSSPTTSTILVARYLYGYAWRGPFSGQSSAPVPRRLKGCSPDLLLAPAGKRLCLVRTPEEMQDKTVWRDRLTGPEQQRIMNNRSDRLPCIGEMVALIAKEIRPSLVSPVSGSSWARAGMGSAPSAISSRA